MISLPFELRQKIANYCTQADAFHLCLVSQDLYQSSIERIYRCIVIDESPRIFGNNEILTVRKLYKMEHEDKIKNNYERMSYTLVQSIGGIKGCLRTLMTKGSEKGQFIKRFECLNCKEFPERELQEAIMSILSSMTNLRCLIWRSSVIPTNVSTTMMAGEKINTLCLNLPISTKQFPAFKCSLTQIQNLTFGPYEASKNLKDLAKCLSSSGSIPKLKSLYLSQDYTGYKINPNNGPPNMYIDPSTAFGNRDPLDINTCQNFFGEILKNTDPGTQLTLHRLGIEGATLQPNDFQILKKAINSNFLRELSFVNISEIPCESGQQKGLLEHLIGATPQLKNLTIDYCEAFFDSVPKYIESFDGLTRISVTIRWNSTKARTGISWSELCANYFNAIVKHKDTLEFLSIETVDELPFANTSKRMTPQAVISLKRCKNLKGLRISLQSFDNRRGMVIISKFHNLLYLDLFGGSGPAYLGQPVSGLSLLLEAWTRYESIAIELKASQPSLQYIKIDDQILDVRVPNKPIIREGLDEWFQQKVKNQWQWDY